MVALNPSHGSNADVLTNGLVMSQYFNDFSQSATRDKAEVSAFKQLFKSYVAGMADNVLAFGGMYDSSNSTAEDAVLTNYLYQLTSTDNMWFWSPLGAQGSSAAGNVAYSISGISTKYEIKSALSSANLITAEVQMDNTGGGLDRGNIYSPYMTQAAPGSSNSIDYGSTSSANGGVLIVHAFSDTASLVVNLQDSADNSTFANVTGYSVSPANATAAAYRYPAAGTAPTGTVRRYTRITWTGTGTFLAFFSRK